MNNENDAKFVERISRAIYDSNSTHKDADLIRLFDLARRGAAAADRIAQLEAALRSIERNSLSVCAITIARAALEASDDQ